MKKLLSTIAMLVLVCTYTFVCADATKELTFQGVEWFSTPNETISKLKPPKGLILPEFGKPFPMKYVKGLDDFIIDADTGTYESF